MKRWQHLWVVIAVILSLILGWGITGQAQDFPTKPITLVIPYPAGGSTDLTGRAMSNAAKNYLGQPVICENKGGGGGTVGPALVISKPPTTSPQPAHTGSGDSVRWPPKRSSTAPEDWAQLAS